MTESTPSHHSARIERSYDASDGPRDRAARMRMWHLLRADQSEDVATIDALDARLIARAADARESAWLARQVTSAAVALGDRDRVVQGFELLAAQTRDPVELTALTIQRGWLTLDGRSPTMPKLPNDPERPGPGVAVTAASIAIHARMNGAFRRASKTLGDGPAATAK